jgi:elongation factor P
MPTAPDFLTEKFMATTADFRNGLCMEYNNDIYTIVEFQHVKPGKGGAFVRTKLKSLTTGKVIENTFNAGVKITTARVERRPHQYLYKDDMGYHFMDSNTFEQVSIQEEQIDAPEFLKDGQEVEVIVHDESDTILGCELPQFVALMVTYTEPGMKGDTATNATKPATLETGAIVQVPLFVDQDVMIKVDTRTKSYVERVK